MKTKENSSAFPACETEFHQVEWGLTKREYFAAKIMEGFAVSKHVWESDEVARRAVMWADDLINALNKMEKHDPQ